tara:strand:- start:49 stop:150 length:102 start_codon:yes stop_codon:yes gene_type:complete
MEGILFNKYKEWLLLFTLGKMMARVYETFVMVA